MKEDVVLISTHHLGRAGALRDEFSRAGYGTDLVTPDEEIRNEGAVLLVLTGGLGEGGGNLARQARERLKLPVFAIASGESLAPALRPGFDEVFTASTTAADVAAVGRSAIERRRLQRITGIVGETDAMREVLERVVQIAPVSSTVLVTGESGTGKELVARGIHGLSPRRHRAFIAVNVAALSETLLESELFGHEKGAFTGAIDARRGLFELAEGGTIFLDEIGEMPLATQTQTPAGAGTAGSSHRVGGEKSDPGGRAHHRGHRTRGSAATHGDRRVPPGPLLPPERAAYRTAGPAGTPGRHPFCSWPTSSVTPRSGTAGASPASRPEAVEILREYVWPGNYGSCAISSSRWWCSPTAAPSTPTTSRGRCGRDGGARCFPHPSPAASVPTPGRELRPELEFVFRTRGGSPSGHGRAAA